MHTAHSTATIALDALSCFNTPPPPAYMDVYKRGAVEQYLIATEMLVFPSKSSRINMTAIP